MQTKTIAIVGGVAGGASAAARLRRLDEHARIIMLERGNDISFANCGMPYYIGGEIREREKLKVHDKNSLAALLNIEILTNSNVSGLDLQNKTLEYQQNGQTHTLAFDKLILSPGAKPIHPSLPGADDTRIKTLRNLADMDAIKAAATQAKKAVIIGAGFIGLEMAEQLHALGLQVSIVELQQQILPQLDAEMTNELVEELVNRGINLYLGDGLKQFQATPQQLVVELNSGTQLECELCILSIGVSPENNLAKQAGLALGARGHIQVNQFQQTGHPDVYAVGDVCESNDALLGGPSALALGGPANRQGRIAAEHIVQQNSSSPYRGNIGTAIVRVFDKTAGVSGYTLKRLAASGIEHDFVIVNAAQHASYYPGASNLQMLLSWEKATGRVLGAQISGSDGVDKRLDVMATALAAGMKIEQLAQLELSYAPPFGNAKDIINIAAFAALNKRDGLIDFVYELPEDDSARIIDVRPREVAELRPLQHAINIPLSELRQQLAGLDADKNYVVACNLGKTSYFAARILAQHGLRVKSLGAGLGFYFNKQRHTPQNLLKQAKQASLNGCNSPAENSKQNHSDCMNSNSCNTPQAPALPEQATAGSASQNVLQVDCRGLACPGPIVRLKQQLEQNPEAGTIEVLAEDSGFISDIKAFAKSYNLAITASQSERRPYSFTLQRQPAHSPGSTSTQDAGPARKGVSLVVFSNDMDKLLAALVIANGALAMGGKATLFFTFWGLSALRKQPERAVSKDFMGRMFGWMLPKNMDKLPLSRMNMFGMGAPMLKMRMRDKNLPNPAGLLQEARAMGLRIVACTMSMEAMGITKEELIDGVEYGGVADFLDSAGQTATNMFI